MNCKIFKGCENFFLCPSNKGDCKIFSRIWNHFCNLDSFMISYLHEPSLRSLCMHCVFKYFVCALESIGPSVFWHVQWLSLVLLSPFYFKWAKIVVQDLIFWFDSRLNKSGCYSPNQPVATWIWLVAIIGVFSFFKKRTIRPPRLNCGPGKNSWLLLRLFFSRSDCPRSDIIVRPPNLICGRPDLAVCGLIWSAKTNLKECQM